MCPLFTATLMPKVASFPPAISLPATDVMLCEYMCIYAWHIMTGVMLLFMHYYHQHLCIHTRIQLSTACCCDYMCIYVTLTPLTQGVIPCHIHASLVCTFTITSVCLNAFKTLSWTPCLYKEKLVSGSSYSFCTFYGCVKTCDYYRNIFRDTTCITSRYHYTILLLSCQSWQTSWYRHLCTICILTLQEHNWSIIPPHLSALQSVSTNPHYVTLTTVTVTSCL